MKNEMQEAFGKAKRESTGWVRKTVVALGATLTFAAAAVGLTSGDALARVSMEQLMSGEVPSIVIKDTRTDEQKAADELKHKAAEAEKQRLAAEQQKADLAIIEAEGKQWQQSNNLGSKITIDEAKKRGYSIVEISDARAKTQYRTPFSDAVIVAKCQGDVANIKGGVVLFVKKGAKGTDSVTVLPDGQGKIGPDGTLAVSGKGGAVNFENGFNLIDASEQAAGPGFALSTSSLDNQVGGMKAETGVSRSMSRGFTPGGT